MINTSPILPSPPHKIGPTWQVHEDGTFHLPELSLGWGVLDWWSEYVNTPAGENDYATMKFLFECGRPLNAFVPTKEQARFTLWWYAIDKEGNWLYREGILRRIKGWGKDPFAAALALAELCGPVRFSHFDKNGEPVGKRQHAAWVTIAAVSQDQTKNTFALFPVMMSKKLKSEYSISPNRFIIYEEFGGRIESATSSPASMEGNRPTFVIENEIQWWGSGPDGKVNDGHAMHDVIEGNITKIPSARRLAICNAHIPGNDSVLEMLHDKWMKIEAGDAVDVGMLYDALEAPADTPISEIPSEKVDPEGYAVGLAALMEGLLIARGDSVWLPLEEIMLSILDISNKVTESRRKFLNQVNAAEDSWVSPNEWARVALTDKLFALKKGERITLGFDGSKSNDWTALVACRVSDGCLFVIKVWDPANYGGEIPREDVDTVVRNTIDKYDVVGFRADIREFEAYVDLWGQLCRKKVKVNASPNNPVAFDMRSNQKKFALDCERFYDAVVGREVFHDNNPVLRQHVLNAKIHPTIYDANSIRKASKDSSRKIDAAVCAVLAFGCRQEYLMSKNYRTGRVTVIR